MNTLLPNQAAKIASGVYLLRQRTVSELANRGISVGCEDMFSIGDSSRFVGRSGGLYACKALSGYGYIAEGLGDYRNQILVVTRGTKTGFDWLSNANVGMQIGPGGELVHAGFHEIWKSFSHELSSFLRGRNPSIIHCVGHSLGGALATLSADYFSSIGAAEVKLYSFGCPRTGGLFFARSLGMRVGEQNIYRVHHRSDPVPKLPFFPFFHVPANSAGYQLTAGPSGLISTDAHDMDETYLPGVARESWPALGRFCAESSREMNPQPWLVQVAAGSGSITMGSAWALSMISKALGWLLREVSVSFLTAINCGLTAGLTVLDQLAWMLSKGAELSFEVSQYVRTIITAIFRFLGRSVIAGASLTLSFIRWVLDLLYHSVATVAGRALSLLR
jgi:triacylglycerol lipase